MKHTECPHYSPPKLYRLRFENEIHECIGSHWCDIAGRPCAVEYGNRCYNEEIVKELTHVDRDNTN